MGVVSLLKKTTITDENLSGVTQTEMFRYRVMIGSFILIKFSHFLPHPPTLSRKLKQQASK